MSAINFPNQQEVEEQAAAWVAVIDRGITDAEQLELETWLERSPLHGEMLIKCASMWDLLDVLQPIAKLMPMDSQIEQIKKPSIELAKNGLTTAANDSLWLKSVLVVASVFLIVGAFIVMDAPPMVRVNKAPSNIALDTATSNSAFSQAGQRYKTSIGEFSSVTLADGSVLDLNTDTEIEVWFTESERRIELKRGEVYFDVEKDATKPFLVKVGADKVTAVGTAFSVNADVIGESISSVAEVIVTEGKVKLDSGDTLEPVYLLPGQKAVAKDEFFQVSDESDSDSLLAWREGIVVFQGESLTEVIREIDRYTPLTFKLLDAELASVSVGGYFKTGDLQQLLMILENNFGVAHQRVGNEILLSKIN